MACKKIKKSWLKKHWDGTYHFLYCCGKYDQLTTVLEEALARRNLKSQEEVTMKFDHVYSGDLVSTMGHRHQANVTL